MIKVRDGYGKLIGSDYNGNIAHVLLSNGGNLQYAVGSTASTLVLRNASGQIESSVASTVAPFVISSTKVNANLNADLLDGFLATGLFQSLTSAADKNLYIKIGDTEKEVSLLYASYLGGVTKEGLFTELTNVNDSTNPDSIKVTIGDTTKYLKVAYADLAGKVVCSASANDVDRPIVVTNKSNGVYYSTKVTLNYSTGNVTAPAFTGALIGNADTASKLQNKVKIWGLDFDGSSDVAGDLLLGANKILGKDAADIVNAGSNHLVLGYGSSEKGWPTYVDGNPTYFRYGASHSVGMFLDSSGKVGIGNIAPQQRLDVSGKIKADALYLTRSNGDVAFTIAEESGTGGYNITASGGSSFIRFYTNSGGSTAVEQMRIHTNGCVGIGTTAPIHKLQVAGAGVFNNTGSTTYASSGITIGAGDAAERYITCYGKTGSSYINVGYGPGINNSGEFFFNYVSSGSTSNYSGVGIYGGANYMYLYPDYTTFRKPLVMPGELYSGNCAINMSNSDIININALYTADNAENGTEGLQFSRGNGYYDSIWASSGTLYFSPNGNLNRAGSYSTNYTVIHSGNIGSQSVNYATSAGNADTVDSCHKDDFLRRTATLGFLNKFVLEDIPKGVTQVGSIGWTDYQNYPHAGGLWMTLRGTSSLSTALILFPSYSMSSPPILYSSIDGGAWQGGYQLAYTSQIPTTMAWGSITGKPSTFTPSTHYHNYFPENTAVYFRDPNSASWRGGMYWGSAGNEALCFAVANANTSFRFFTGSDLANWTSSTWQGTPAFEVNKNGAYAPHFYENSDAKLKENIQAILDRDNIPQIKEFDWKEDGSHSYGLIAQELEELGYSELVSIKDDGYKTVNYSAALSLIVGKLQVKIKELEKEIEILKNKN